MGASTLKIIHILFRTYIIIIIYSALRSTGRSLCSVCTKSIISPLRVRSFRRLHDLIVQHRVRHRSQIYNIYHIKFIKPGYDNSCVLNLYKLLINLNIPTSIIIIISQTTRNISSRTMSQLEVDGKNKNKIIIRIFIYIMKFN